MKTYLPETLKVNILKQYGYPKEAGITIQGIADIRFTIPVGEGSGKMEKSERVNYTAKSVEYKEGKFDWSIQGYKPL